MLLIVLIAMGIVYLMQMAAAIACMSKTQKEFLTFLQAYEAIEIQEIESDSH
jgi:hypothetical protein